ncbi:recombinase family protein [Methylobacterium trifolii]|nr:recombinase family protein [Methylobacterium trifolii]
MAIGDFISYLRVSTRHQGADGHGIAAQRAVVESYLNGGRWRLLTEYVEVESGKRADRLQLRAALDACRLRRAALVVAKVDRLTRSVAFLSQLLESGVDVRFADMPALEGPTGRFMLQQMAAVAELEAGLIGQRTRAALAAAKARGKVLGGNRGTIPSAYARQAGVLVRQRQATDQARLLAPVITELQARGAASLRDLAAGLDARGIGTARGSAWTAAAVSRVLARIEAT